MFTKLAHPTNYRSGRQEYPQNIVIHFTGNNGDTARGNLNYFANNPNIQVSANLFVDETEVCISVPFTDTAYHCSSTNPEINNNNSIGVELCSIMNENGDYYFDDNTVKNAIEITKSLMTEFSIPIERVFRHYDATGKICPRPFVGDNINSFYGVSGNKLWIDFKNKLVEKEEEEMSGEQIYKALMEYLATLPTSEYAEDASKKGVESKIFSDGDSDGLVDNPKGFVLRQDLAVVLNRLGLLK